MTRVPARLKVGQEILIDPEGMNAETGHVVSVVPLVLERPLNHFHWAGEEVKLGEGFKEISVDSDSEYDDEEEYSAAEESEDQLQAEQELNAMWNKLSNVLRPSSGFRGASFPKPKKPAVEDEKSEEDLEAKNATDMLLSGTESEEDQSELIDKVPAPKYANIYFHHGKLVKAAPSMILALFDDGREFKPEPLEEATRPRTKRKNRGPSRPPTHPPVVRPSHSAGAVSQKSLGKQALMGTTVELDTRRTVPERRASTAGPPVKTKKKKRPVSDQRARRRQRMAESIKRRDHRRRSKLAKAEANLNATRVHRAPREEDIIERTVPVKLSARAAQSPRTLQEERRRRRQKAKAEEAGKSAGGELHEAGDALSDRTQDFFQLEGFEDDEADAGVDLLRQIAYREKHSRGSAHEQTI